MGTQVSTIKKRNYVSGITSVVINLVALAILVEVIYGQGIFGMGVIGNITKLVNDIGSSGFAGLVSLLVLVVLFKGKKSS
jgi:hypothetical protein